MSTTPAASDPDAQAMASICEQLTMQVRRIADALTTPVAVIRDGVLTPLDADATAPATTCSAQYMKHAEVIRSCIRAAHHIGTGRPHTDEQGFCWSDTTAVYPADTRAPVVCNEPGPWGDAHACIRPAGHTDDHEADDGCGWRTGMCDTGQHRQHSGFTCPEVDQSRPYWNVRWEQEEQAPAADEDAARTARRDSLRNLIGGGERIALALDETALLRRHVEAEIREHDTMRAVAAGNRRHVQVMYAEVEAANESAHRALQQRQEMAQERYVIQEQRDTADRIRAEAQRDRDQHAAVLTEVLATFGPMKDTYDGPVSYYDGSADIQPEQFERWRSTIAPTVERPWWETVTELRDELKQMRALAPMLDGLHTLLATSSRDWQPYRVDAWLWAVLCGWDCEQDEHDETCTHGALEETAALHGWDDATVAKARRYRAAVRAVAAPDDGVWAPDPPIGCLLLAPAEPSGAEAVAHIGNGANAEDCPACSGSPRPYPFICPGPEGQL